MLEAVKLALGITIDDLDDDISANIMIARAELIRAGVIRDVAMSDMDVLVEQAIKTYCKAMYTTDINKSEKLMESFKYQQECLRKSIGYSND